MCSSDLLQSRGTTFAVPLTEVREIVPSRSKPDRGTLRMGIEARNQAGDVVMTATLVVVALRRRGAQPAY
mgnify:CR=1 FL=1